MEKITFWDAVKKIGLSKDDVLTEYKAWFLWHNRANPEAVLELLKDNRFRMLGKLRFYCEVILGMEDKRNAHFTWEDFAKVQYKEIAVYRGNGGVFNPKIPERFPFVAMTASYDIALMFAKYEDAKAVHLPAGPERKSYWVVRVKLSLKEILGYRNLKDMEVWIRHGAYETAEIITQCRS